MRTIKIGNKEYNISYHASSYREYEEILERNIMKDINSVQNFLKHEIESMKNHANKEGVSGRDLQELIFNDTLKYLDEFIECITKICWVGIYDNNKNIENYEKWYHSLERLSISDEWVMEVMALSAECFC